MKGLFFGLQNTLKNIFALQNVFWLLMAFLLTYVCVITGLDWQYFLHARGQAINTYFFPAIVIGGLLPMFLPIIFLIIGKTRKREKIIMLAFVLAQAAFLGWFLSSFLKFFTGRLQPNLGNLTTDISGAFNFGIFQHGIFWGWPSSHTTVAFSVSFALIVLLNHEKSKNIKYKILKYVAFLYALYVGIGVSISIHWLSDFIAGMILGIIIGREVGKTYLNYFKK